MSEYRLQIPPGKFGTILIDPPWLLNTGGVKRRLHYDTMSHSDLLFMDKEINDALDPDGHVWLWAPNSHIPEAIDLIRAWDLQYKTMMTWAKPKMGLGWWLRGKTEQLIFAVKSNKHRKEPKSWTTLLEAPWRGHSVKPEEAIPMIEELSPPPYLELFARAQRPGWTCLVSNAPPVGDPYGRGDGS